MSLLRSFGSAEVLPDDIGIVLKPDIFASNFPSSLCGPPDLRGRNLVEVEELPDHFLAKKERGDDCDGLWRLILGWQGGGQSVTLGNTFGPGFRAEPGGMDGQTEATVFGAE